ncbi:MAG: glutathione S-transferase family protein [Myxococcales bacterium]|nr:glutathione S-transferase family protein [Myxococcales bacterium]MCB9522595.1 glutathione S-transferase family protein [Myxococcales bacterium]
MTSPALTLYYAPRTRSRTALWLLEELGQPYALESFDMASGRHRQPDFLALNPMGKVPLVMDGAVPVSELGAIAIHLADRFPQAGLAPAIDHPHRPAYLRWCFFASAIMEPCLAERFFKWQVPDSTVAWGSYDRMMAALQPAVADSPWLLGDAFSAADVLVGAAVDFGLTFGAIEKTPTLLAYQARLAARPAYQRADAIEARESTRFPRNG